MKSLPILTVLIVSLCALAWTGHVSPHLIPFAAADDESQTTDEKEDTADSPTGEATPTEDEKAIALIEESRHQLLDGWGSVQAKLRETVSMGPRRFRGEGTYIAGRFPKLRLSMGMEVGDTQGQLLEVCDGTILWTVQEINTGGEQPDVQVARTVISDVIEAQADTADVPETYLIMGLGVGGLPALLASLQRSMTFEAVREIEEEGQSFSVIQGRWSDEYLSRLTGGDGKVELPDYMPDHVRIYFDAKTKFPTRILYLRRVEPGSGPFRALLSLEFSDVVLDAPISEEQFQYTPPSTVKVRDRTAEYLKMLDEAAAKGREEGPVRSDGSVPVGKP